MESTFTTRTPGWKLLLSVLAALLIIPAKKTSAQALNSYTFSAFTGTFTPLTGGTVMPLSGGSLDNGYYSSIPIGFNFSYNNGVYNTAAACTNGFLSFVSTMTVTTNTNNLSTGGAAGRPLLIPFWDNLDASFGSFTYKSEEIAGDSIFTAEWLNMDWQNQGGAVLSFQVKLFRNSGAIQFIYRQESTPAGGGTASIGITSSNTGAGNYISLQNTSASPTVSLTTNTNNLGTLPATDQIYQFIPPAPAAPLVTTGTKTNVTSWGVTATGTVEPNTFPIVTASGIVLGPTPNPLRTDPGVIDSTTNPVVTSGPITKNFTGLANGTTYYYRTYAENSAGITYGPDSSFTTNLSATTAAMNTTSAFDIGYASAVVGGVVQNDGGSTISVTGIVYGTSPDPSIGDPGVVDSVTAGPNLDPAGYTFSLEGLSPSTKYYYRAYAINGMGTGYSVSDSFTTDVTIVNTGAASLITTTEAHLEGDIRFISGPGDNSTITASGIVVSITSDPEVGAPGVTDSTTNPVTTEGTFSLLVGGLTNSTLYHYRAYVTSAFGTFYGADQTFTTNATAIAPVVDAGAASDISGFEAVIGGRILSNGGDPVIASGVVYSTTTMPALGDPGVVDSTTTPLVDAGKYSFIIGGLTPSTKYYFRAYATNAVGTSYSATDSFTTAPVISALPYSENFDGGGVTGWNSTDNFGAPNDWALGTPSKAVFTSAFSVPNAWVTRLSGDYSSSHDASVVSPQFDFSALAGDPILRFKHRFLMEPCCDGGFLEMSINNGPWTRVEDMVGTGSNFNTPGGAIGWYNANNGQGNCWTEDNAMYASNAGGWITSQVALTGAAGEANVKVRFTFVADGSIEADGWEFDNIEVYAPAPPSITGGVSTNVTMTQATINASIIDDGGNAVTASGVVYSTTPAPAIGDPGVVDSTTNPVVINGPFSIDITGLSPATTYYYRTYAINAIGTTYSADSTFTTNSAPVAPYVSNVSATDISGFTATIGGTITSDGGDAVIMSGVVYSTTPMPVIGGPGVVDSTSNPMVSSGSFTFSVSGLTPATRYYYRAYATNTVGTSYSTQDSFTTDMVVNTFPYNENFDGAAAGWFSQSNFGMANDWILGTPSKPVFSSAFSAPSAWVTKLAGDYSDDHDGSVVSPQMDFSSFTSDPLLRFKHRFRMESCCDGGFLEISINNGPWTRVEDLVGTGSNFNTSNAKGWYNNSNMWGNCWTDFSDSYSGVNSGWLTSQVVLTGAAGQSNVRIRFSFGSDGSVTDEGWEFDNVEVFEQTAPVVIAGLAGNITQAAASLDGNIVDDGGSPVTASGIVYSTTPSPVLGGPGVTDSTTNPVVTEGLFSVNVTGLAPSTLYYYRAYATNSIGTSYSADSTFTTNASAVVPYVSNVAASQVGTTSATIGGNITSDGGDPVTASGIIYSTSSSLVLGSPGVIDSVNAPAVTSGPFSKDITGLAHSTIYYFRAYATNSIGTGYGPIDSFITSPIVSAFPYMQNFDSPLNTGWTSESNGGAPNDWVVGTPAKSFITGAFSAPNAWVTRLAGPYSTGHDASVVSPQFDFSALTNNPVIRFNHKWITESCCDGGLLEMSIAGGPWVKVEDVVGSGGNFNTPVARSWYNSPSVGNTWNDISTLYSSEVSGWVSSQVALPGAAGQSNVKIRFTFISDGSIEEEGWIIDDIEVLNIVAPTVQATSVVVSGLTNTSADVSWTNGNGERRIVVARLTSTAGLDPANLTEYTADASFGAGSETGTGNFVVYDGTGSSVTVTGLALLTNYTFTVYEYNGSFMHNRFMTPGASNNGTTLPVKLVSFTGVSKGSDVSLSWATASEINNKGFEVERSADNRSFEFTAFVKGAGNSSSKLTYGLTDARAFANAGSNVLYYRLKQVDMDGSFAYSNTVRVINGVQKANAVSVYPNPFSSAYNVAFNATQAGNVTLKMTDIQGRVITEQTSTATKGLNEITISNLHGLEAGIYFVKVTVEGETQVLKLVKN